MEKNKENKYFYLNDIGKIWDNEYIQKLGIYDHCIEVCKLIDELRLQKAIKEKSKVDLLENQIEKEMCDLYIILSKFIGNRVSLLQERLKRFNEKANEEK